MVEPTHITEKVACCVHTSEYVDKFFNGKTSPDEQRTTGFTWSPGLASRVRYETGGISMEDYAVVNLGFSD